MKAVPHFNEIADNASKYSHTNIQFNCCIHLHTTDEDIDLGNNIVEVTEDNAMVANINSDLCENIQLQRHNSKIIY